MPLTSDNKVLVSVQRQLRTVMRHLSGPLFTASAVANAVAELDWLMRVEGMTATEAVVFIKDWPGPQVHTPQDSDNAAEKLAFFKSIWTSTNRCAGRPSNACKHG